MAKDTIHDAIKNALSKMGGRSRMILALELIRQRYQVALLVVDVGEEEIEQWIG